MTTTAQSRPLAVPSDLSEDACKKVGDALLPLTADAIALYIKTKNYHWHMTGSHFKEYHELLDEQSDQVFAMIDILAERARKLGQPTVHSVAQVASLTRIKDDIRDFVEPRSMFTALLEDNKGLNAAMRSVHEVMDETNDVATASLLENFIDETERRIWFLYETVTGLS
jgi:starvation-inducible DNA-binding protein